MKDMSVLMGASFTDRGSVADVFTDLTVWQGIRKTIEQINANKSEQNENLSEYDLWDSDSSDGFPCDSLRILSQLKNTDELIW